MNSSNSRKNVIIAGGGTGGHIYPGLAIARMIEKLHPELKVTFVGAEGALEETIVPREGFPLRVVPVGKLHHSVGLATRLITVIKLPLAFFSALKIFFQLKPVAVLGVGGFASGPMIFVSALFGKRTLIWEPNAYPGLANRMLARFVDECLVVFEEASSYLKARKITRVGLPVRSVMIPALRENRTGPLRVLVFGGSQGAKFVNTLVAESVKENNSWIDGIELVHQTGAADFNRVKDLYKGAPERFQVFEYLHDMNQRYAWADLVVCRSGASTVAEICACHKAAIFIPLPTAADDHQRKNAEVLQKSDAAMVYAQKDLNPEILRKTLQSFRDDRNLVLKFEKNIQQFQYPRAAEKIVERLLDSEGDLS